MGGLHGIGRKGSDVGSGNGPMWKRRVVPKFGIQPGNSCKFLPDASSSYVFVFT